MRHGEAVAALALLREQQTALGAASSQSLLEDIRRLERGKWKKGMRVRLEGLEARADLNGSIGVLLGGVAESGRAPVKLVASELYGGMELRVKPANLRVAPA
jgi:hypothetical protein